ncbi:MAG: RluA family pseudouridine synthase [Alphaproteobacteria bacterium]|nr:RluA family pseudouridine synthase [Alphaproteobacteria bacterium]
MIRLLDHLKTRGLSNREARAALTSGKVWVSGVPTADGGREVDPASVAVRMQAPRITVGRDVVVLWRDPHLAVVWKPPGMLAVPAPRRSGPNVLEVAGRVLGSALPVHRLDEGTSGLMMVARTPAAQTAIKDLLERHAVERRYLALAVGRLRDDPVTVRSNLVRDRGDGLRGSGQGPGKEAVTHLRTVSRHGDIAMLEATLETGRTHQVRIHCAEQGCPLLGDPLYAPRGVAARSPRLALHAAVLGFEHPLEGGTLRFEAPLADDLAIGLRQAR